MPIFRNVAGAWKPVTVWRRIAGVWKIITVQRRIGGLWKVLTGNVITVGVVSGSTYGYNNAGGGSSINPATIVLGSLGAVTPSILDDKGATGGLMFRLTGAYANSGWTTLYIRSPAGVLYSYLRSAASYSTPSGLATVWDWGSGTPRPFGTVVGATAYVFAV
jgi:hypothetical protein